MRDVVERYTGITFVHEYLGWPWPLLSIRGAFGGLVDKLVLDRLRHIDHATAIGTVVVQSSPFRPFGTKVSVGFLLHAKELFHGVVSAT